MQPQKPTRFSARHASSMVCACAIGLVMPLPLLSAGELTEGSSAVADPHAGSGPQDHEWSRRQALMDEAHELMRKGQESLANGRPDEAMQAFIGVRDSLPEAPATHALRQQAAQAYAEAAIAQAGKLVEQGDLAGARALADSVLAEDMLPGHAGAAALKQRLNDPVRHNPALTRDHVQDVAKVRELLQLADGSLALGQYDLADGYYQDVLRVDPYNVTARRGLERLSALKADPSGFDETRAHMLAEVDKQWELQVPVADDVDFSSFGSAGTPAADGPTVAAKVERLIVPRLSFDEVTLEEAVDYLRTVSRTEDRLETNPDAKGVNFNINLSGLPEEAQRRILDTRFDLQLNNVPLQQALQYITQITKTSYQVDDFSVLIRPQGSALGELIARTYQVPPDFVTSLTSGGIQQQENDDPFSQTSQSPGLLVARKPVEELLKSKGVTFPEGSIASFSAGTGTLRVVNTALNHDIISNIIETIRETEPVAVSVQVTVLKIQQDNVKELGFDWLLNSLQAGSQGALAGGTIGSSGGRLFDDFAGLPGGSGDAVSSGVVTNGLRSGSQMFSGDSIDNMILNPDRSAQVTRVAPGLLSLSGVFTDAQAQIMMRGLDQKTGTDMMACPSVVTTSGQAAKVVVAREFIYPTEYDPPEVGNGGNRTVTPANPTAFETRNVGITLEVLPVADADKTYIDLTLNPEIVEFDGFVNFGSPISSVGSNFGATASEAPVLLTSNRILMPIFSTQRTTSQLTIADGATIVYAGLLSSSIQTVNDKVPVLGQIPVLGRMFQSDGARPMQTAVVFMVRVQLMDPTGRPFRELSSR